MSYSWHEFLQHPLCWTFFLQTFDVLKTFETTSFSCVVLNYSIPWKTNSLAWSEKNLFKSTLQNSVRWVQSTKGKGHVINSQLHKSLFPTFDFCRRAYFLASARELRVIAVIKGLQVYHLPQISSRAVVRYSFVSNAYNFETQVSG